MNKRLIYKVTGYDGTRHTIAGRYYTNKGITSFCGLSESVFKKDRPERYWPDTLGDSEIWYQRLPMGFTPEQAVKNFEYGRKHNSVWYTWIHKYF